MHRPSVVPAFAPALIGLAALAAGPAAAAEISSVYERFSVEECPVAEETDREQWRRCDMKNGPDLVFILHEHGVAVLVEPAASEGRYEAGDPNYDMGRTGHFGDIFADDKGVTTLEWRVEKVGGKWQPFAAIYRTTYTLFGDDGQPQNLNRLDILKIGADHACQIGEVGNVAGQNEKARAIADAARDINPCPALKR
ncbi:MAG: hypothetical protein R3D02_04500 [Hyphomicrobiales bacterium]